MSLGEILILENILAINRWFAKKKTHLCNVKSIIVFLRKEYSTNFKQ